MKILGICGSPKKGISEEILEKTINILSAENEVEKVVLSKLRLDMCDGCLLCEDENTCPHDDDIEMIRKCFLEADWIIVSTPVYFDNVPGILKNLIDRSNLFCNELSGKKMVAFVCGQADKTSWDACINVLRNYCDIVGMNFMGSISVEARTIADLTNTDFDNIAMDIANKIYE